MDVLLVDDNPGDLRLMEELLKEDEDGRLIELTSCQTLDEAMRLLVTSQFDAVLLDLGLPGTGGLETLTTVLGSTMKLPAIIVTTGNDDRGLTRRALRAGAQDYLIKGDFNGEQVCRAIRYAVERKRFEQELANKAYVDPLTGLANRTQLVGRLASAITEAGYSNHRVGVLFLDLDGFKAVNDILGHSEGDQLLRLVSEELLQEVQGGDVLARFGGDEFVLILRRVQQLEEVTLLANRVLQVLRKPRSLAGREFLITGSVGISLYPEHGRDTDALLASADAAMYMAKEAGKDTHRMFGHHIRENLQDRLELESELRRAIHMKEFVLHYQPLIEAQSGLPVGLEALVRWNHPQRGVVTPAEFIPLLEETGLILPVGEWVIQEACAQAKYWAQAGLAKLPIAVNLSPRQFWQPDLLRMIRSALADSGVEPETLHLEITEAVAMRDIEYAIGVIEELKEMGVRVWIDDFGTGHSSLSYLRRLPIDGLKIDQSFVEALADDAMARQIAAAIITLAHAMNLSVVAEGVESPEQLFFLQTCHCDEVQGHFFSPPLAAEAMWDYLGGVTKLGMAEAS